MDPSSIDIKGFDKDIIDFFNHLKNIIKTHENRKLNLSGVKNPILSRLEKYIKIYDRTEANEHIWYFKNLYNQNKRAILRGPERDAWLSEGNITLHYGEETGKPIKDAQIHLSIIYNTSIKLKKDIEETLQDLPNVEQSQELIFPGLFLLYLYKIFYNICNEDDKEKLLEYVSELETDTGTKISTQKNKTDPSDGLEGLLGMASGFMEKMGVKMPEGQKLPSGDDLNKAIGSVFQNPEAKSLIGDIMKDMQDCDNFGDMVGKLLNKLPAGMDTPTKKMLTDNVSLASDNKVNPDDGGDEFIDDEFIDN